MFCVYDISNRQSFDNLRGWISQAQASGEESQMIIIGAKVDLAASREVSAFEGRELAAEFGAPFVEVSSKTGQNVDNTLLTLIQRICSKFVFGVYSYVLSG